MTKDVSITMKGTQKGMEEAPVLTTAEGSYHLHQNKHYIQYEEQAEEGQGVIKNMIKISPAQVELTKKGAVNSEMIFNINQKTEIVYRTAFGTLFFDAQTSQINIKEEKDRIEVLLEYRLLSKEELISENTTIIRIIPSYLSASVTKPS